MILLQANSKICPKPMRKKILYIAYRVTSSIKNNYAILRGKKGLTFKITPGKEKNIRFRE